MYVSRVVTGRIIEMRGDSVLTSQGDAVNTYNLRFYTLRDLEIEPEPYAVPKLRPEHGMNREQSKARKREDSGIPLLPWPAFWKKDVNRI